jgi:imidazole glycerol phosphate synthase glutamine amidotransferase subunit
MDMKKILIIDTKAGNLFSIKSAIERLGFKVVILDRPDGQKFDGVVIPGQGRFGEVVKNIRSNDWDSFLSEARKDNLPILGICVGMQIFFEASDEDKGIKGLGWFKGAARALDFPKKPMVGWANINSDVWPGAAVYFVNSYAIKNSEQMIASTNYGETFCAAVSQGCFTGVQFHPEKSSLVGSAIIKQALNGLGQKL